MCNVHVFKKDFYRLKNKGFEKVYNNNTYNFTIC